MGRWTSPFGDQLIDRLQPLAALPVAIRSRWYLRKTQIAQSTKHISLVYGGPGDRGIRAPALRQDAGPG